VAGGAYRTTAAAQKAMTGVKDVVYKPIAAHVKVYAELYEVYRSLHDGFGKTGLHPDLEGVMKKLIAIRQKARQD
jgi:L-ribulokinase